MKAADSGFDEHDVLHDLKHYLPAQAPLKDFIHHNTLHAFQNLKFFEALRNASVKFGYSVSLSLQEYRDLYSKGRISHGVLDKVLAENKPERERTEWLNKMISGEYPQDPHPRIGSLRSAWKKQYKLDLDSLVHTNLFRIVCSFLDQGISIWNFPVHHKGFLTSIRELEKNSFTSFFRTTRARDLLLKSHAHISDLLKILVGDESLYRQYLFDQQFSHQGWSGMVSVVEDFPETLLDQKKISLKELVYFELLLEIDALDFSFGEKGWKALSSVITEKPLPLFAEVPLTDKDEVMRMWQLAFEWTYYDEVLAGIQLAKKEESPGGKASFQAMFCIDDRECSFRRHIENLDPQSQTFATPGFFGVEFFFKPENGKFVTKLCPAPVTPKYLIKEGGSKSKRQKDLNFNRHSHSLFRGWLISQTLGFWSAFRLFWGIFKPSLSPATAYSFRHMDKNAKLTIECKDPEHKEGGLQVGYTITEMTDRLEGLLRSIGLVKDFAPLVYVIGHGSSSVNNPHYAAYDCGACSGRAGSVNARVICYIANHPEVRKQLAIRGIEIPASTQFLGGLHDTTRDEVGFFDEDALQVDNAILHKKNEAVLQKALDLNAKERSRRFVLVNTNTNPKKVHERVKLRSVSLFEPRPELNHATNALCIVGRRELTKHLFLDRRSFMNSFDYRVDPEGKYLFNILKAAAPVCGGINLEYFFSRVDNQKLGAGTKLPHNVMGLFGVANGIEGDLRPGLPSQMIEVHDPVRLLIIVEHFPHVVLQTIQKNAETYEWFINEWVNLVVVEPESKRLFLFKSGEFVPYEPLVKKIEMHSNPWMLIEKETDNLPVFTLS